MGRWKKIKNTDYYISDNGLVKDKYNNFIMPNMIKGYKSVNIVINDLNYEIVNIHKLVAEAFIDNPDNKTFIKHINGNRKDNTKDNLLWTDPPEKIKENYISITNNLNYRVRIPKLFIDKVFKTLDEAIEYRNNNLQK